MIGSSVFPPSRVVAVCALVCLVYSVSYAYGEYEGRESSSSASNDGTSGNEFGSCTEGKCTKRNTQGINSGMWFGPRLGRRRRADGKFELDPDIEAIANILDGGRWALVTVPGTISPSPRLPRGKRDRSTSTSFLPGGEKRQSTQFTPRLGRDSGEDNFSYRFPKDREELYAEEQIFPPLFAPRLGRRLPWTPSPRLGRQPRNLFEKPRRYADDSRF
ncbi:pheromone biosynthesis-activating neuropeptide isoform X1 [Ptiloglossa arizonensis]|uniref:pheromone biosynthesis-activating neuropeptide isoform X1 n=1 Tax=Ptiloglossa arizonensis TaxID=3350558 RepID=UPI003FA15BDB